MIAQRSISLRLTCWYSAVFLFGLIVFCLMMWLDLAYSLSSGRSKTLSRRATRLIELLHGSEDDSSQRRAQKFEDFARSTPEGSLIQVFDADGKRIFPAASTSPVDFPWPKVQGVADPQFSEFQIAGRHYRILVRPFYFDTQRVYVCVGGSLEDNDLLLQRFTAGLWTTIPPLLVLSALGGYFLSRRALRPVDRLIASARSISIWNLSARLPVSRTGDELQRLSETCNDMLARLESAVQQIKRFTADASHELRNPISLVRTAAELALGNPGIDPESRCAFEQIVQASIEAGRLLEDMLTLARADADSFEAVFAPIDLARVVHEVCEKARHLASDRGHTLTTSMPHNQPLEIMGDDASVRRLLWILLDNAVKYSPAPGRIDVALRGTCSEALITVKDNGIGIPESDLPHVFQRFYRAVPSRSQVDGTGLGLAIAKWIAEMHHAHLSVESKENLGATFQIVFPQCVNALRRAGL